MSTRPRRLNPVHVALGAAGAIGLGAWGYSAWVHPNLFPRNFGVVEEGKVYRSAALTPAATRLVHERHGIRTIVDLGGFDKDPDGERIAQRTAEALGIERFVFPLSGDGTGNPNAYVAALKVISDPARQPVLVHCSAGAQRTSGCIMLYKDIVLDQPLDATYPEARQYRHDPEDNPRLLPYLREWGDDVDRAYRTGEAVEGFPPVEVKPQTAP